MRNIRDKVLANLMKISDSRIKVSLQYMHEIIIDVLLIIISFCLP